MNMLKFLKVTRTTNRKTFALYECECGVIKEIRKDQVEVKSDRPRTYSCGCLKIKKLKERKTIHGLSKTPEYRAYHHMKERCYVVTDKRYKDYGGRGIKISKKWLISFDTFYKDMGKRPSNKYSIDRIDNNGDYCKENCKWSTAKEQQNNTRRVKKSNK